MVHVSRMLEDEANMILRARYLFNYFLYREQGRPMIYMDESWINKNACPTKIWHDGTTETVPNVPAGKGPRWIMLGAGSKDGWVPNTFKIWKGN